MKWQFCLSLPIWIPCIYVLIYFLIVVARTSNKSGESRSSHRGAVETNLTRNYDVAGSIPAGLSLSHSNTGSEPHLQPTQQLTGNTRSLTHRVRPRIKPIYPHGDYIGFLIHWTTTGTSKKFFLKEKNWSRAERVAHLFLDIILSISWLHLNHDFVLYVSQDL